MGFSDRCRRFRTVLAGRSCVHPAAVFDPLSARMAADLAFEVGILAGSTASLMVLGAPDLALLTLSELAEQVRRITRAGSPPLIVDADHGFGNALSVMRTVEELEAAGAAAVTIEDTLLPQAYGSPATRLIALEEGIGKIRAAVAARVDPDFCIIARTNAMTVTSLDDATVRSRAYADAGADAIFLSGVGTRAQLQAVHEAAGRPIVLGNASPEVGAAAILSQLGVRIALQGNQPFLAAVRAAYEALKSLRDATGPMPPQLAQPQLAEVTRSHAYDAARGEFLGTGGV